jgi:hypothetical protein
MLQVTMLSFAWVRQELKADREWERLHGRRPTKVQAPTTDPLDDREGTLLLRELRNVASVREGANTTVGRRKPRVNCVPHMSEQQIECVLKRDGNCKDGAAHLLCHIISCSYVTASALLCASCIISQPTLTLHYPYIVVHILCRYITPPFYYF